MPDLNNKTKVSLTQLDGKKILGVAAYRSLVLDRPLDKGGDDVGFTSSQLLLLAIGSCALAGVRRQCAASKWQLEPLSAEVAYVDGTDGADDIRVSIQLRGNASTEIQARLKHAATTGGVTSRIHQASKLLIDINFLHY